jgi:multiple sugar transport system permease protein
MLTSRRTETVGEGKGATPPAPAVGRPARRWRTALAPLPWIGPAVVLVLGVVVWPAVVMVRTSFQRIDIAGVIHGFDGTANYSLLFHTPALPSILVRTIEWVLVVVVLTIVIALALAVLMNAQFPGRRLARWALIVPWAVSVVMSAIVWKWMLDYFHGVVNHVLVDLGVIHASKDWLGTPGDALWWMMAVAVFVSLPVTTYVVLAGMQAIPGEVYEAAQVDGASRWRTWLSITLPLLRPALLVGTVVNLINVFNSFPIIWVMTQGGPGNDTDTTTTFMYKLFDQNQRVGESAAMAVVNFVVILVLVGLYLRAVGWGKREQA